MNWAKELQNAIDYIEEHLTDIVDLLYESENIYGICYGNIPTDSKTFNYAIGGSAKMI